MTTPATASRPRRAASVGIGVAVCVGLAVVVVNPRLGWFVLAGIGVGLAAGWLIAAVRHRRWWRLAVGLLVIGVVSLFILAVYVVWLAGGPVGSITRVPMWAKMEYRADKQIFEITDSMQLTDEGSKAICIYLQEMSGRMSGQSGPPSGDAAGGECANGGARDAYARTAVLNAGWTQTKPLDGHPRFTRSRQVAVDVPRWWPLSVTRSVPAPEFQLDNMSLVPDQGSTATIFGPEHFISPVHTVPRVLSTELVDGGEKTTVPISYDPTPGDWDSSVQLELVSGVARNPVVAPLVDFSWWKPVKWIVLFVAGVFVAFFRDQLKDIIRWSFGALARRTGPRKKPDADNGRHRAGC